MKKLHVLIAVVGLLIAGSASAQTKIAYVRIDDIVRVMPELDPKRIGLDTVGQKFVQDSVMPELNYKQNEYNKKMEQLKDTVKNSVQIRTLIIKDLQDLEAELSGAENLIQQVMQAKLQQFLEPYYEKARKAIEQVAKEKGYTHVMNTDIFLVAPDGDNISLAVLAKLGIKLPNQTPPPANNKPAPKTGN